MWKTTLKYQWIWAVAEPIYILKPRLLCTRCNWVLAFYSQKNFKLKGLWCKSRLNFFHHGYFWNNNNYGSKTRINWNGKTWRRYFSIHIMRCQGESKQDKKFKDQQLVSHVLKTIFCFQWFSQNFNAVFIAVARRENTLLLKIQLK